MIDPLFWLGLSILLVAVSLTAVLMVAIPAFQELGRAARSAEKLFDTLSRELPPTLEAIRLTGLEISDLTDDVSEGVQSAGQVAKQVDQSLTDVKQQAQKVQITTRSVFAGVKAAWKTLTTPELPAKGRRILSDGDGLRKQLRSGTRSSVEPSHPSVPEAGRESKNFVQSPSLHSHRLYGDPQIRAIAADPQRSTSSAEPSWHHPPTSKHPIKVTSDSRERDYHSETRQSRPDDEDDLP